MLAVGLLVAACGASAADTSASPVVARTELPSMNGGISKEEADAMRQAAHGYSLEVTLARRGEIAGSNEFIADARLRVTDRAGRVVIDRDAIGPIFLAGLPDGAYTVEATYAGQAKSQSVQVSAAHRAQVSFLWQ